MIYLFTWNSTFLISENVFLWKNQFIEKYWDFNLLHLKDINSTDKNFLSENLFWASFLSEKKLIIIDIDDNISDDLELFLTNSFSRIPENNILLLNYPNPDKRKKFFKEIDKIAEKKEYNAQWETDIFSIVQKKYKTKISPSAISLLIKYKWNNISKVISEIEKLLITNQKIEDKDIYENIMPELEESIFQIIDDILMTRISDTIKKIDILTNEINVYAFYNNLLANLRTSLFIMKLKNEWKRDSQINDILALWNKAFLINKKYNISYNNLKQLFIELIDIDKKMKSWYLLWSEDCDFLYEIQNKLIKFVK